MRSYRLAAALALCALAGCRTTGGKYLGYGIGGVIAAGGAIGVGKAATDNCDLAGCELQRNAGVTFLLLGAAIVAIAASIEVDDERAGPPPATVAVTPVPDFASVGEPPTADPELRRLTLQARVAARRDQCPAVLAIAAEVERIDAGYRQAGFVADAPVAHCLR